MIRISDDTMSEAMAVLAGGRHAIAKVAYERLTRQRKALLARLERESNGKTQRERETYALGHPHLVALDELLDAAEAEYHAARDERDSAETVTRVWQTVQADARAAERVR
jgi:hypothetical protein